MEAYNIVRILYPIFGLALVVIFALLAKLSRREFLIILAITFIFAVVSTALEIWWFGTKLRWLVYHGPLVYSGLPLDLPTDRILIGLAFLFGYLFLKRRVAIFWSAIVYAGGWATLLTILEQLKYRYWGFLDFVTFKKLSDYLSYRYILSVWVLEIMVFLCGIILFEILCRRLSGD